MCIYVIFIVAASVFFDPDVYEVSEGHTVQLWLKTDVIVDNVFSVIVEDYPDSAISKCFSIHVFV